MELAAITTTDNVLRTSTLSDGRIVILQQSEQPLARLQIQRNDFQMLADKDYFSDLVKVACYLDALRFYRKGVERHRVFTFGFIREVSKLPGAARLTRA